MRKDLAVKQIYDDFTSKIILNDTEKEILLMYVKNKSIVQISNETNISTSSVSRTIAEIKNKYERYKKLEIAKLTFLVSDKWK